MSSRSEKNVKQLKEKHQVILNDLLREEANRYCADCAAKGPRWASWNLGVFLCIRCAGIHRNLGVHISRVKSVNLDSWTAPQIESIQSWGNGRAKQYYECYLPTDFVRPQGDSAMETLIRNKYERKLYIRKGGEPPKNNAKDQPKQQESRKEPEKKQEKLVKIASERKMTPKTSPQQAQATSIARPTAGTTQQQTSSKSAAASVDLLGIDTSPQPSQPSAADQNDDEFSLFMAAAPVNNQPSQNQAVSAPLQTSQAQTSNPSESLNSLMLEEAVTTKANTKDSIMSLYQSGNQQQKQMFGVPGGVYMSQQQQQQQQQRGNAFPMQGNSQQMMPSTQQSMPMPNQGMRPNQQQQQQQTMNQYQMMMNAQQAGMKQNFMPTNQNSFSGNMMNGKVNMNPNGMQQAQPGMSNMMTMQVQMQMQMQNMNLARSNQPNQFYNTNNQMPQMQNNQQFQAANFQSNMGQNVMANSYGQSRPMMPSQQPILVNGQSSGMGFANTNMGMSQNMGHTLNNQLWK